MGPNRIGANQTGSMLVFVMILIATLSIFCVSFSSSILDLQKQVSKNHIKSNIQYDSSQLSKFMKLPNGLVQSSGLLENQKLYTCLRGGAAAGCSENCCKADTEEGFYYLDPGDPTTNTSTQRRLSGPISAPVFYRKNGTICASSSTNADCAYSIATTFVAHCPGGESVCAHAEHLKVKVQVNPNPSFIGTAVALKAREYEFVYFVNRNYQPQVVVPQTLQLFAEDTTETEIDVTGDSGHPSEIQNFIFTKCLSENPAIAELTTPPNQPFASGVAKIRVKPVSIGTTRIALRINDGGIENNLSLEKYIDVTVLPGASP